MSQAVPESEGGVPDAAAPGVPLGRVPARVWYARSVLDVAPDLLGAHLTVRSDEGDVTVRLTEVEAYAGEADPGSHAFRGRTARNAVMFGEPGRLYVYRHLGLHHCVNVVTGHAGTAAAVLLRAGEVVAGGDLARVRGIGTTNVDSFKLAGFGTVEEIVKETDLTRIGNVAGIGIKKARQIKAAAEHYMNEENKRRAELDALKKAQAPSAPLSSPGAPA